jgi:hypothetical protein
MTRPRRQGTGHGNEHGQNKKRGQQKKKFDENPDSIT